MYISLSYSSKKLEIFWKILALTSFEFSSQNGLLGSDISQIELEWVISLRIGNCDEQIFLSLGDRLDVQNLVFFLLNFEM
jgi:hypothetical protein